MGTSYSSFCSSLLKDIDSYDNSGHKMTTPTWASNSTNVARTNSVLKEIAEMFTPQVEVASIVAPLNE